MTFANNERNMRIDFLRGIAILLVLLLHFHLSFKMQHTFLSAFISENILHAIVTNGNYGVTMFFVISGYLITTRSLHRYGNLGNIKLLSFYQFRFARIIPGIVLALTLISILSLFAFKAFTNKPGLPSLWQANLSVLTFWHNILMEKYGYFNYAMNIYWSLSVEEVFYLLFPIACILIRRKQMLCLLAILLVVYCPIYRHMHNDNELFFMYDYLGCFDAIAIGCLAAILRHEGYSEYFQNKLVQLLSAITLCATYLIGIHGNETIGFTTIAFAVAILILGSSKQTSLQTSPLRFINNLVIFAGKISYELYLMHIIVLGLLRDFFLTPNLDATAINMLFFVYTVLSFFIASACHYYYTEPLNNMIRRVKLTTATNQLEAKQGLS